MLLEQLYYNDSRCDESSGQDVNFDSACSSSSSSSPTNGSPTNGNLDECSKLIVLKRAVDIEGVPSLCDMIREDGGMSDIGDMDSGTESDVEDQLGDRMVDCGSPVQFLSIDLCDSSSDEDSDVRGTLNSALYASFTDLHQLTDESMIEQSNYNYLYSNLSSDEETVETDELEKILTESEIPDIFPVSLDQENHNSSAECSAPFGNANEKISRRQMRYSDTSLQLRRCWRSRKPRQVIILPTLEEVSNENIFDCSIACEQSRREEPVDSIIVPDSDPACDPDRPSKVFNKRIGKSLRLTSPLNGDRDWCLADEVKRSFLDCLHRFSQGVACVGHPTDFMALNG